MSHSYSIAIRPNKMDHSIVTPDTPAMRPPNGVIPNFDHPHGIISEIYATLILSMMISTVFVWTRLYTRYFIIKAHGWEDYTSFIAWAGLMGYAAIGFVAVAGGSGVHLWDIRLLHFIAHAKVANVLEIYYNPLIFITKLSILIQFMRIFVPNRQGKTYWCIHCLIWVNFLFYAAAVMIVTMACLPRAKIWNPTIKGHCINLPAGLIAGAVINVVSDFSILILPIAKVWHLQLSRNRKIGVSTIFATGGFACLSSILRLVSHIRYAYSKDVTYRLSQAWLWATAEVTSGVFCGCLPILPRFFQYYTSKIKKTLSTTFRGRVQKVSQASWPKDYENHNSTKFESAGSDGRYLELNSYARSTNL